MRSACISLILLACLWTPAAFTETSEETQLTFADGLFQRGFYEDAAREYRVYLERFPDTDSAATALYRLGEAQYAMGAYDEALTTFEAYLQRNEDSETARMVALRKGEVLYRTGKGAAALAVLEPLRGENIAESVRAGALYYEGKIHYEAKRFAMARGALETLVEDLPNNGLALYGRYQLALVLLALNDREGAAVAFSAVAGSEADADLRAESRFRAGEAYDSIGWHDAAATAYRQLQDQFPESNYADQGAYGYAWSLYHGGDFEGAAAAATEYIKAHGDTARGVGVRYLLANCRQQTKDYDAALKIYQAIEADYADSEFAPRSAYRGAWVLYLQGQTGAAQGRLETFVADRPDSPLRGDASFLLGTIFSDSGDHLGAHKYFRTVADEYGDSSFAPEALYKAGESLAFLRKYSEAAALFEAFVEMHPSHDLVQQARLKGADSRFYATDFDEAVTAYESILAEAPEPDVERETLHRLAATYFNRGDHEASAKSFTTLLEKYPEGAHIVEAHLRVGNYLVRQGDNSLAAIQHFQKAYDAAPEGEHAGRALAGIGMAHYHTKDYDGAARTFQEVISEFPGVPLNQDLYAWLGQRMFDEERYEEAGVVFRALLQAFPEYPAPAKVRLKVGEAAESAGDLDVALAEYGRVLADASAGASAVEAKYRMAGIHKAQGKSEVALALYEEAAAGNSGDVAAQARFRMGEIHEGLEDYEAAARSYMLIAILLLHEELTPESLWRAGQCYEKMEKADQAKSAYEELVRDYAETTSAEKAQARLAELG
jgi:TolA-binding protein